MAEILCFEELNKSFDPIYTVNLFTTLNFMKDLEYILVVF